MPPTHASLHAIILALITIVPVASPLLVGEAPASGAASGTCGGGTLGTGLGVDVFSPQNVVVDPTVDRFQSLLPWPTNKTLYSSEWRPGGSYGLIVGSNGALLKWTGSSLTYVETGTQDDLYDIEWKADGSQALIVGNRTTIMLWDAATDDLTRLPFTGVQRLFGVTWTPSGHAIVVGDGGFVATWNGSALNRIGISYLGFLYRVSWRPGADYAAAVGDNGVLLEVNETALVRRVDLTSYWMLWRLAWANDGSYALVVGAKFPTFVKEALAARYDASGSFTELSVPGAPRSGLRGVAFATGGDAAIIVGENSTAALWNGTNLTGIKAPDDRTLRGVEWEGDGVHAYAIGNRGVLLRWDGAGWIYKSYDPRDYLTSIAWRPQGDYGLVVGRGGFMSKVSTSGATRLDTGVTTDLNDVDFSSDGTFALACGAGGRVLRYDHSSGAVTSIKTGVIELRGVSVKPGEESALVVGDVGQVWLWAGGLWFDKKLATVPQNLWDVAWRPDGKFALIVGASGVALNFTGGSTSLFQPQPFTFATFFSVAWAKDGSQAMAVGSVDPTSDFDTVWVYDNVEWLQVASQTGVTFFGCAYTADGEVGLAFGNPDVIIKFSTRVGDAFLSPFTHSLILLQRAAMFPTGRSVVFCGANGYAFLMQVGEFANRPPVVRIAKPTTGQHINVGTVFDLDATGTIDGDGDALSITWSSNVSGVLATGMVASVSIDAPGWHRITCTVDDGHGHNVSSYVVVSFDVPNYAPVPFIASPLEGETFTNEQDIVFDANGSSDANGDNLTFQWVSALSGDIGYEERVVARLPVGAHRVILWVDDGLGGRTAAFVNVTITQANRSPTVYITSPIEGTRYDPGTVIQLNASYSNDPDGDALSFTWKLDSAVQLGTGAVVNTTVPDGAHRITVEVDDGHGHLVTRGVNVTFARPPNQPPALSVDAPDNNTQVQGVVTIVGSSTDGDGPVASVRVSVGSTSDWLAASGTEAWSFLWDTRHLADGLYQVWVEASDGELATVMWVQYVVSNPAPPNEKPTVVLTTDLPGSVSGAFALEGTASDVDGTVARVQVRVDDDAWVDALGTVSWSYYLDTKAYDDGPHTLSVRAYDGQDYSGLVTRQFIVDNGGGGSDGGGSWGLVLAIVVVVLVAFAAVAWWALRARRR